MEIEACAIFDQTDLLNFNLIGVREKRATCGFGLSISEELLKALGGRPFCITKSEEGCMITFEVPIGETEEETGGDLPARCEPPLITSDETKVLVIDDCPFNTMTIRMLLQSLNIACVEAHSASEGIRCLQTDEGISLVLLDLEMPEINGFECMQMLQTLAMKMELASIPPVVAHSASAFEEDRKLCQSLGFVSFLEKPVSKAQLLRTIQVYTSTD